MGTHPARCPPASAVHGLIVRAARSTTSRPRLPHLGCEQLVVWPLPHHLMLQLLGRHSGQQLVSNARQLARGPAAGMGSLRGQ